MLEFFQDHWIISSILVVYIIGFLIAKFMGYPVFQSSIWPLLLMFIMFGNIQ